MLDYVSTPRVADIDIAERISHPPLAGRLPVHDEPDHPADPALAAWRGANISRRHREIETGDLVDDCRAIDIECAR